MLTRYGLFPPAYDFDALFGFTSREPQTVPVDISETEETIVIAAEMPGVAMADIDVTVERGVLSITGSRNIERNGTLRSERYSGSFSRSFTLPETVDVENIKAQLDAGILTITMAKLPNAGPRKIEVRNLKQLTD